MKCSDNFVSHFFFYVHGEGWGLFLDHKPNKSLIMVLTTTEVNDPDKSAMKINSNLDKPNLKGDWMNFFLLLLLYTMQGLPLGLSSAIPILLQSNKNVSYKDQVN